MFSLQLTHISPLFRLFQRFNWYKIYVLRTGYVKHFWSDYWFITWVKNPTPASCWLVVPIVVSRVHHRRNRRWLMHGEFNSACIIPKWQINNHFNIFLRNVFVRRWLWTKPKRFFQFQQRTETNKKLPGLRELITSFSVIYIAHTPQNHNPIQII